MTTLANLKLGQRVKIQTISHVARNNEIGTYYEVYKGAPEAIRVAFPDGAKFDYWAKDVIPVMPMGRNVI